MSKDNSVLFIGDIHSPAYHPDTVKFLAAVKKKFKPKRVILSGDEINWESISFHQKDPNLPNPSDELDEAIAMLKPIYLLFPKADVLESNHGDLVMRKAKAAGLPSSVIRSNREMIEAPKGWNWFYDLTIKTDLGPIYFHHGKSSSIEKLSKSMGMSAGQGHYHSKFYISYWASPMGLFFDMNAGAFLDQHHAAAAYAKNSISKGIMGVIMIEHGVPQLIPMVLNKKGKWINRL